MKKEEVKDWTRLQIRKGRSYRFENPDLPTLQPWQNMTYAPATRYVFARNPYYHRVDQNGVQLPYVDQIVINIAESSIIPAKAGSGEADLQERYLSFSDYTFLKEGEKRNNYTVRLWTVGKGAAVALFPNLNTNDVGWRALFRDVRFRRALSLGIDRTQINQVLFAGLAKEGASTVLPGSQLFRDELGSAYAEYDPEKANALLDEIGLKRGDNGIRLMPDGRALDLIIESTGESSMEADVLELVTGNWADLGVKLLTRTSQRDIFRSRVAAGETNMSVWAGVDNGAPTPDFSPQEFVPSDPYQLQWPMWGTYVSTQGTARPENRRSCRTEAGRPLQAVAGVGRFGDPPQDLGGNPQHPCGPGLLDRHRDRDTGSRRGLQQAAQRAGGRHFELRSLRLFRSLPDGLLLDGRGQVA